MVGLASPLLGPEIFLVFWENDLLVVALLVDAMVSTGSFSSLSLDRETRCNTFYPKWAGLCNSSPLVGGSLPWFLKSVARFFGEGSSLQFRFCRLLRLSLKVA